MQSTIAERFLNKVEKSKDCWNWIGMIGSKKHGYGAMKVNGKRIKSHRLSWELHCGRIPKNLCVLHKCDNRKCVRPSHLFLGTLADNMYDRKKKGKYGIGEKNPASKFTEIQVKKIIKLYRQDGLTAKVVGKMFNTSEAYIWRIVNGYSWKYLQIHG